MINRSNTEIGLPDIAGKPIKEGDVLLSTGNIKTTGSIRPHAKIPKGRELIVVKRECYYIVKGSSKRSRRWMLTGLLVYQNGLTIIS